MSNCSTCVVRNRSICSALDGTEISALGSISRLRSLAAGEPLLWEGDDSVLLANVVEGALKLTMSMPDGGEQIVGVVYAADFIGRPFGGATPYGVTALTDAQICVFAQSDFERLAAEHPTLEQKLLERTLDELDRTRRWMLLLGRMNAEQKLASFLLELSERLGNPGCEPENAGPVDRFELDFSRQQIGDVLGMSVETVSRQFTRLTRQKIIANPTRRAVVILDRGALAARAG